MIIQSPNPHQPQSGYSLIEVLVALFVLAIGLLGLAALQTTSFKFNSDSYARTQATLVAYEIIDRIRANPSANYEVLDLAAVNTLLSTDYGNCKASTCNCNTTACDSSNLALFDLGKWYEEQARVLPDPANDPSTIVLNGDVYTITIRWKERELLMEQVWDVAI